MHCDLSIYNYGYAHKRHPSNIKVKSKKNRLIEVEIKTQLTQPQLSS